MAQSLFDGRVRIEVNGVELFITPNSFKSNHGLTLNSTRIQTSGTRIQRLPVSDIKDSKGSMEWSCVATDTNVRNFKRWQASEAAGTIVVKATWEDNSNAYAFVLPKATLVSDLSIDASPDGELNFQFEGDPIIDTLG